MAHLRKIAPRPRLPFRKPKQATASGRNWSDGDYDLSGYQSGAPLLYVTGDGRTMSANDEFEHAPLAYREDRTTMNWRASIERNLRGRG